MKIFTLPFHVPFNIFLCCFLFSFLFSSAGTPVNTSFSNVGTLANRLAPVKYSKNFTPLNTTESLAADLYLLQPDSSLVLADGFYAQYNDAYHDSVTIEDALKLSNPSENIGLFRYGKTLVLERRPIIKTDDTLFIKLWNTTRRSYQIELVTSFITNIGLQAYFVDSYLNTKTALGLASSIKINFSINADPASAATNRFKIIFKPAASFATLPVTFSNTAASRQGESVTVKWSVQNEINMATYEVEKSFNGRDFSSVAVEAVSPTNTAGNNYSWTDGNAVHQQLFYRVKGISIDGSYQYTQVVEVAAMQSGEGFSVFPNPVQGNSITFQMQNQRPGTYQLRLLNMQGQSVYTTTLNISSGNAPQAISIGKATLKGIYQLEISNGDNNRQVKKIVVE